MTEEIEQPKPPQIIRYGVFRSADKMLVKAGTCLDTDLHAQAGDGEYALEGEFKRERKPPVLGAREKRRRAYPTAGDQLGAIVDLAKAVKAAGIAVPASVDAWIEQIEAVKAAHAKD